MESRWPEHTPEPDEPPQWRGLAIAIAALAAIALLLQGNINWFGAWQAPNISMPEINMPDLDLRGRSGGDQPEAQAPASAAISEGVAPSDVQAGAPMVQQVPFDACLGTIDQSASAFGPPAMIENAPDRRVARFKLLEGALTVTCSRPDGTMTIERTS